MRRAAMSVLLGTLLLSACIQFPTEKQEGVDLRPQISFSLGNPALNAADLEVLVDGLPVGSVSTYLAGQQAVRVLPGNHVITIRQGGRVLQEDRLFIGDAMTKIVVVQ